MRFKVAGIQLGAFAGDYEEQMSIIAKQVESISQQQPDLICLPELMTTPYFAAYIDENFVNLAEEKNGKTVQTLQTLAKKTQSAILGTFFRHDRREETCYNSSVMVDKSGAILGYYDKTHIPLIEEPGTECNEKFYFSPGNGFKVFQIKGVSVGVLICYDRSFPEAWRSLVLQGAQIVCVPASSSGFRSEGFIHELQVRAQENGVFVFAVNKAGEETIYSDRAGIRFYGKSCAIDPFGNVILNLEGEPGEIIAEFDLAQIPAARKKLNYYRDRRPELYGLLTQVHN